MTGTSEKTGGDAGAVRAENPPAVVVTRGHRLAAVLAVSGRPPIPGSNTDGWCTFGGRSDGETSLGGVAQAIAEAEQRGRAHALVETAMRSGEIERVANATAAAFERGLERGRAAERVDVVAWMQGVVENGGERALMAGIAAGEHVRAAGGTPPA